MMATIVLLVLTGLLAFGASRAIKAGKEHMRREREAKRSVWDESV